MKRTHRKCLNSYQHFFVTTDSDCIELDLNTWDRTITMECSRCGYVLWIDSVIRLFEEPPQVWRGS